MQPVSHGNVLEASLPGRDALTHHIGVCTAANPQQATCGFSFGSCPLSGWRGDGLWAGRGADHEMEGGRCTGREVEGLQP